MRLKDLEAAALALPGATLSIQWGDDRVYRVCGKMFAATHNAKPSEHVRVSFKCSDVAFAMLTDKRGIVPAPYLARAKWVQLENPQALSDREITARLAEAHRIVLEKLPKKTQAELAAAVAAPPRAAKKTAKAGAKKRP